VQVQGARLRDLLTERFQDHPHVGDIRGRGLFMGLELVADRATRRPFAPELKLNARIKAAGMERGLICYAMGGTIDGRLGDHVLLAPPFIVTDDEIEDIVGRLGDAVDAAIAAVASSAA
jgi:adenosylmethionine-8-amino-7-oxononanoate aminotransferase